MGLASEQLRGARLLVLRQLNGLNQSELAGALGIGQAFISQVERGLKPLPTGLATAAAERFAVPMSFFTVPRSLTEEGFATFRRSAKASSSDERIVAAHFGEAARLFERVSESSGYRTADFGALASVDPESAAQEVRQELGLGDDEPVMNATRAVERLGVGVIHNLLGVSTAFTDHVGMSRPNPYVDRPLVATLGVLPGAESRITVMHELAHLIFDRDRSMPIRGTRSLEERRAFRFAGAVLLPAGVVKERIGESLTLHGYLPVKANYGISVSAIIVRAAELGVISPERKRTLMVQLSSSGWRREEPVPVASEQPILVRQATLRAVGNTARQAAESVGLRYEDAVRWTGLPLDKPRDGLADVIELHPRKGHGPQELLEGE